MVALPRLDLDSVLSAPADRQRLLSAVVAELRADLPDMVVSSGTEALVLTSLVAAELQLPMAYLRPKPKSHGRRQRVEGQLRGANLALIAVEPTPETVQDNLELVAEHGARIARVVALGSAPDGLAVPVMVVSAEHPHQVPSPSASPVATGEGSAEQIAKILLDMGAVIIRQEPFRYASGILSPIYTDCRLLISYPQQRQNVLDALERRLQTLDYKVIDGVATSGIPHASVLAHRLHKPLIYVNDGRIVGAAKNGDRVAVIEDLVTTGKSVLEAAAPLREHGLRPDRCLAIFTYSRQQPALEAAGIAFDPLSDLETLLQVGVEHGYFGDAERQAVLDWRRDPQDWTARHEPIGR